MRSVHTDFLRSTSYVATVTRQHGVLIYNAYILLLRLGKVATHVGRWCTKFC